MKPRARVDGEEDDEARECILAPNITAGPELLFSHSHHNSFILTAPR